LGENPFRWNDFAKENVAQKRKLIIATIPFRPSLVTYRAMNKKKKSEKITESRNG
jgi:hypothetical protein